MFKSVKKNNRPIPFNKLFQVTTPKDFVSLFNFELAQTKAFILSFSPHKNYVKKVLYLLDEQEPGEDLQNRPSFIIREYLNRCQDDNFNISFVHALENEVDAMVTGYENCHELRKLRKKLLFKHSSKVRAEIKAKEEESERKAKEIASKFDHILGSY